jgi:hypothetical protein
MCVKVIAVRAWARVLVQANGDQKVRLTGRVQIPNGLTVLVSLIHCKLPWVFLQVERERVPQERKMDSVVAVHILLVPQMTGQLVNLATVMGLDVVQEVDFPRDLILIRDLAGSDSALRHKGLSHIMRG